MSDLKDRMMQYELGELDEAEIIDLFQELIDCGIIWALEEKYLTTAKKLLSSSICSRS